MKISMKDIRVWYQKNYGNLENGDIAEGYDVCDIIWFYEKDRDAHLVYLDCKKEMADEKS